MAGQAPTAGNKGRHEMASPRASRARRSARSTSNRSAAGIGPPERRRRASAAPSRCGGGLGITVENERARQPLDGVGDDARCPEPARHRQRFPLGCQGELRVSGQVGAVAPGHQQRGVHERDLGRTWQQHRLVDVPQGLGRFVATPSDVGQTEHGRWHAPTVERVQSWSSSD